MAHSYRGRLSKDGPIKSTFGESIRQLAKSYYPYIYSDSRNISKPVVDLQSAFEICSESLEEYDRVSGEMTSLSYSIFGLEQALYRALTELTIIREEVCDLMNALRTSEKFNLRLLDQLSVLDETIQSGVDSGKSVLSASKLPLNSIGMAPEHYMIPRATRETLENIIDQGKPGAYSTLGADSLLKEKISPDYARLTWLVQIQRDLANRHAEFSFLVISLWSEQVRDNFHLSSRKNGCFPGSPKTSYDRRGRPSSEEDNFLRMASAAKIEELPTVVQTIQGRVFELGGLIVDELNRLRAAFEETKMQHRNLNVELNERRRQLIDSLLATHSAVQTLLDLDERNDALVGKLVKTRPLFADLYRIVQSETLSDEIRTTAPIQGLADVLGPQNWKIFVDQLAKLRVNPTEDTTEVD
ncbi:hypothetical protein PHET_02883 [Paragonimus heterotremus]|uniref:Uncharacterized protein n=1 Tax=Paragonimus heterotremus TaxID=100268 RepID=A0A8J4TKU8_9TREM|nr:hypothetical protein PHET_02883 [Paragonimus heterotremus]